MTVWTVSIDLEGEPDQVGRLRQVLPNLLVDAGFRPVSGTRTVESSFLQSTESLRYQNGDKAFVRGVADWVPVARRRGRGSGPQG